MKEIDPKELSQCNGKNGNPAYVAYEGKVYDVTASKLWKNGMHMARHASGQDLTIATQAAPHGPEVLERYPQIGILKVEAVVAPKIPELLAVLLKRFPRLRRHPHPMTIHFPIVFMFSATIFTLLYLFIEIKSLETTALYCLAAGLLFTPLAMLTGYYTWWLNYMAKPIRAVSIKKRISLILFGVEIAAFIWRITVPDVLDSLTLGSGLYLLLVLSLFPLVTVLGWFGASLSFPVEKE
jgi:predicted heme/steroid binding protein/uncharacterized membrane protein